MCYPASKRKGMKHNAPKTPIPDCCKTAYYYNLQFGQKKYRTGPRTYSRLQAASKQRGSETNSPIAKPSVLKRICRALKRILPAWDLVLVARCGLSLGWILFPSCLLSFALLITVICTCQENNYGYFVDMDKFLEMQQLIKSRVAPAVSMLYLRN